MHRADQLLNVPDAHLVQVAVASDTVLEQRPDVALVVVLAQDDHADVGIFALDHVGRLDPLHGMGRRHLDVHQHNVRSQPSGFGKDPPVVRRDAHNVEAAALFEQPSRALTHEVLVLGDQHTQARVPTRVLLLSGH
jgi:hypothetical protein